MLVFGFGHWFIKRLGAAGKVDGTNPVSEVIGGQRGSSMPAASRRFRRAQARPDVHRALPECRLSSRLRPGQFGVGMTARSAMLQICSGARPRASISVSNIVTVSVSL